jgi:hypothetical protein
MSVIDTDVEEIIQEQIEDEQLRGLVRDILRWESDKINSNIRQNKKDEFDKMINEYRKDL